MGKKQKTQKQYQEPVQAAAAPQEETKYQGRWHEDALYEKGDLVVHENGVGLDAYFVCTEESSIGSRPNTPGGAWRHLPSRSIGRTAAWTESL